MAEASPSRSPRAVQIRAPPSLISSIDIVDRATAPHLNDEQSSGVIISLDFGCPSSLFFGQKELTATFNLNFEIQIKNESEFIEIEEVGVGHFSLNNNNAELLNHSKAHPTFSPIEAIKGGKFMTKMCPPNGYCDKNDMNIRIVVLLGFYPSNIDISIFSSAKDGASKLKSAVTGTARSYIGSSPQQTKLLELLCWTAVFGHVKTFRAYLNQMPHGLEIEDAFGMTPFSWAALGGQPQVVHLALQQAGSVGARRRTTKGPSPLEAAAHSQNRDMLRSFLKWLAYIETPIRTDTNLMPVELVEIPELEHILDLNDDDIEREIHSAIHNKQTFTARKLVELFHSNRSEGDKQRWLANSIVKAAEEGNLDFVQALRACGAEVNCNNDSKVTPLMGAIENDETKIAEYLIFQGAKDGDNTALIKAVEKCQHSTIRALLQVRMPMEKGLKQHLLGIASENDDSTTLMLLEFEKGTEKLATPDDLYPEVDKRFFATVADFSENQNPKFTEHTVHDLMHTNQNFFDGDDKSSFKWFHLPANNMKWVEVLISKIYYQDPSLAYKVLEPKRWIKRQHEGENGSSHARFMMSACHDFQEAFIDKKKHARGKGDRHVVLFMPYLHWDYEEAMQKRSEYLAKPFSGPLTPSTLPAATSTAIANSLSSSTAAPPTHTSANETLTSASITTSNDLREAPPSTIETQNAHREEVLIEKYLLSEIVHDENSRHLLHVRRTLDQSLYHNLKDTKVRDADQTVRRYQNQLYHNSNGTKIRDPNQTVRRYLIENKGKQNGEMPITAIMVDQLWLWILLSPSGKAQAVVTCFPSRDNFDITQSSGKGLDPQRTTDVLQTTKSYIQQRPDAVKTPYDLAGVIASRCSRALLDHSTDMLDFTEVYENSISYIMNEEVLLFNTFNSLMQTRARAVKEMQICTKTTVGLQFRAWINKLLRRENSSPKGKAVDKKSDFRLEVDIIEKIAALRSNTKTVEDIKKHCREYREYARFTEIPDEIEMKKLKENLDNEEEHKRLIELLEKFGRFFVLDITREISLLRQIKDIQDELEMMAKVFSEQKEVIEAMDRIIRAMLRPRSSPDDKKKTKTSIAESNPRTSLISLQSEREHDDAAFNLSFQRRQSTMSGLILFDDSSSTSEDEDSFAYERLEYLHKGTQKKNGFKKQAQSMIWHFRHQKHNLPLRTVDRFAKLVKKMNERAKNTNKALTNLVDLKQKQSTMIDTRTARLQAEESHKMAQESESQGRTLMVFTVVTIVFLPLSFIAAFFAIPVKEFGSDNILALDFVSKITFPVSAATSLLFIGIGFAASKWDWFITLITNPRIVSRQKKSDDVEANIAPPEQNSSTPDK